VRTKKENLPKKKKKEGGCVLDAWNTKGSRQGDFLTNEEPIWGGQDKRGQKEGRGVTDWLEGQKKNRGRRKTAKA